MPEHRDEWLNSLIDEFSKNRRCFKFGCTTCGSAGHFRSAVAQKCMQIAGVRLPYRSCFPGLPLFSDIPVEDRGRCYAVLMDALRWLPAPEWPSALREATELLLMCAESDPAFVGLDTALQGSWAGLELATIRAHRAAYERNHEQKEREREQKEREREQRRQEKERQQFEAHERRKEHKRDRDAAREDVIAELRALSPARRFRAITEKEFSLPLEALPSDLFRLDPANFEELSDEQRTLVLDRIGNRRGVWRQLRTILQCRN
jgi:hypothetical protein